MVVCGWVMADTSTASASCTHKSISDRNSHTHLHTNTHIYTYKYRTHIIDISRACKCEHSKNYGWFVCFVWVPFCFWAICKFILLNPRAQSIDGGRPSELADVC